MRFVFCLFALALASLAPSGQPPSIHDAAAKGDVQALTALVARNPELVEAPQPPDGKTPLHVAAQNGRAEVVAILLDKGAAIDRPDGRGRTALHFAASLDDPGVLILLHARGADANLKDARGMTPLRRATVLGKVEAITALVDRGADVRDTAPNGWTLLHEVALGGPPEVIGLFVVKGLDVDAASAEGDTPLLMACAAGNEAAAAALLARGANPNRRGAAGRDPLTTAVRVGKPTLVRRLLGAGATPGEVATLDKRAALHFAAGTGQLEVARMLLAAGASRDIRDARGRTPLDIAVAHGHRRLAETLRGAASTSAGAAMPQHSQAPAAPKPGQAVVWYLGHMGWAVRTANRLLVFDCDGRVPPPDDPSLVNGSIDPAEIASLPTMVFVTHGHADHYAAAIFHWKKAVKDLTIVTGFRPEGQTGYEFMAPRETRRVAGLDITTTGANDEGVGFFVKVDGVAIWHSGDHSAEGGDASFRPEIDYLAGRGAKVDLLFMPISPFGNPVASQGVFLAMERLSAGEVFPGHVRGREELCEAFAADAARARLTASTHCPEFGGDRYAVAARVRSPEARLSEIGGRTPWFEPRPD